MRDKDKLLGCPLRPPCMHTSCSSARLTHLHQLLGEQTRARVEEKPLSTWSHELVHLSLDRTPFPCLHRLGGTPSPLCSPELQALLPQGGLSSILCILELLCSSAGRRFGRKQ